MALTKTTTETVVDPWAAITAGTLQVGQAGDVSANYNSLIHIEAGLIEHNVTHDGIEIIVEASYADDDWMTWKEIKGESWSAVEDDLDGGVTAGDTTADLTNAVGSYDSNSVKWLVYDEGDSEIVRTKSAAGNTITIMSTGFKNNHADGVATFDRAHEWSVLLPFGAARVRVLINNVDADCDVLARTWISEVTALS